MTLLEKVKKGEVVILLENDEPVAKISSLKHIRQKRQFGSAKGKIWMSDDFDEPFDDMKDYM